jgi:hypothetical protein
MDVRFLPMPIKAEAVDVPIVEEPDKSTPKRLKSMIRYAIHVMVAGILTLEMAMRSPAHLIREAAVRIVMVPVAETKFSLIGVGHV